MATNQQFCLRWNNHQRTLISVFDSLLESGTLVDCTLAAEGQYLKAHKVVLSACSPYLGVLLSTHHEKHPILILKDIKFQELKAMLDYMYKGEVNISQDQLCTFLKAAESLQIKGLTESAALNPESKEFEERVARKYERKNATSVPLSNHNIKVRSPPINAIVDNVQQPWTTKFPIPNLRPATPPIVRDGSISPVSRKRRKQQHPQPNTDDVISSRSCDSNQETIQSIDSPSIQEQNVVSPNPAPASFVNTNTIKNESVEKPLNTDVKNTNTTNVPDENMKPMSNDVTVKTEPIYCDPRQISDSLPDAAYEDSMEEMTLDEEEEMDENDIARPGPSNSEDSQPYSSSYPVSCDSDGVSSGQLECQGIDVKSWKLRYMSSWESWSAAHPNVPVPLSSQSSSSPSPNSNNYASSEFQKEGVECPDCGRHYKLKSSLRNHQKWECGKDPQFQCPYCNYRAKQKMHVARHIERMHREKLTLTESSCILNNNNINNNNNNNNNDNDNVI